ncbi:MAG: hypothetical protein QOH19_810 [Actinomycetota bacterium]|jgi:hypothetical protein|nr:hypothetical protein [Actinomycetota bacterium]
MFLASATACAGPGTSPAASRTAVEIAAAGTSPSPAPSPTPSGTDGALTDPETTPGAALAGADAPRQQPVFAAKALDVLATLPVKGRAAKTGYSREQFGQAWADIDRNGCDTRNDMLRRDLTALGLKPGTRDCRRRLAHPRGPAGLQQQA